MFAFISFVLEILFTAILFVLLTFALIYYCSTFIEERMKSMTQFIKYLNITVLVLSVLFIFSDFSIYVFAAIFISNLLWLYIIHSGFPFIDVSRFDFLGAVAITVIAHVLMMLHFLGNDVTSTFKTSAYFLLFVWTVPILIITSLAALEDDLGDDGKEKEETTSKTSTSHSYWKKMLSRLLKKAEDVLPYGSDKYD